MGRSATQNLAPFERAPRVAGLSVHSARQSTQQILIEKRAQEAERGITKAEVQAEGLSARVEALESQQATAKRERRAEEQPGLPLDDQNPA